MPPEDDSPGPDAWSVETVERVKLTHLATGKSAEAPTQDEAFGRLTRELVLAGDITISGPSRHGAVNVTVNGFDDNPEEFARKMGELIRRGILNRGDLA